MRVTGTAFLVGCCSIVGLPLLNGFVGEWLMLRSFIAGSELQSISCAVILPLAAGVLALIGAVAAACFAKLYGVAFLGRPRSTEAEHAVEVAPTMQVAMALLAAGCIAIGILPGLVLGPLTAIAGDLIHATALPDAVAHMTQALPWIAACVAALIAATAFIRRVKRVAPTWGMRWTGARPTHAVFFRGVF